MLVCTARLVSQTPYSQSKPDEAVREQGEGHDDFEERTWRQRLHVDPAGDYENGQVFIPPQAVKNCLSEVAKYLSESVPGKGKATYTKHFEAGVLVTDPLPLGIRAGDVASERLFVPSDGRRGGGSRVWKRFPLIPEWQADVTIYVFDPILIPKPEKIREYLEFAGQFIGLGRFRPRNNGYYGRFTVEKFVSRTE